MFLSLIRQHPRLSLAVGLILLVIVAAVVGGVFVLSRAVAAPPQPREIVAAHGSAGRAQPEARC